MRQTGWRHFTSSNQQLCVQDGAFVYKRSTSQGEPVNECDRGLPGFYRIPVSLEFDGNGEEEFPEHHILHVNFGPNAQAPPQTSSNSSGNSGSNATGGQSGANASNRPLSSSEQATQQAQARAAMLGWVREDVAAYIAASRNGFEAYKKGQPQVSQGLRMWDSSVKPAFAKGCWVVQGDTATTFSCLLSEKPDLNAARDDYTELTGDVTASLPPDWHPEAAPPFGRDFPASKGYRSSSGSHAEIWIARAASGGGYELHYQLVSAHPARPAERVDDDPIGAGGFITPPAHKP
jgi:hypothetical protein